MIAHLELAGTREQSRISQGGSKMRTAAVLSAALGVSLLCACTQVAIMDPRVVAAAETRDPGCSARQLVASGGPMPRDASTLAIRWAGFTNYELVYGGQVILLDTFFDRGSTFPPLGFTASDIKRADLIFLGHAHVDHMSDAATVAAKTGALVVGAPVTTEKLFTQGTPQSQVRTVTGRGGEILRFKGFTVEPILGRHGEPPPNVAKAFGEALRATTTPPTAEQIAELGRIRARGVTADMRVVTEGTIAYLFTFDNGFRLMYRNSGGAVTEYEKNAMARVGRVDVALVAVSAAYIQELTVKQALEHARTYKPEVYIPGHHDGSYNNLWRPTEPLFQALKDENPAIVTVSRSYREPICFDTRENIQTRRQ
jgi:L-ascorbate metabolism protein UlaG (beta-lactamase superfamily)